MNTKLLTLLIYLGVFAYSATAQNLLTNGNFENGFTQWNTFGDANSVIFNSIETTDIYEGTKAMKLVITTKGPNDWSVQSIHNAWPSVAGKEYRLRLYAKAFVTGTTIRAVQQINTYYASHDFTLTPTWQLYEWVFIPTADNVEFKFHFIQTGTILIDDITIEPTTPIVPVVVSSKDTVKVNTSLHFQTMEGFGAAQAYYESWVTNHPNKEALYQLVFQDLGLDWLRLQNNYGKPGFTTADAAELIQKATDYTDDSLRILMGSWSPPASIKSTNDLNGGTLLKDANNNYVYGAFADYWKDALTAYGNAGIYPDWISIQNEPDWEATYSTCKFAPTETATLAGYDQAFDSVYQKIKNLPTTPLMLGAEPTGIGSSNFNTYTNPIKSKSQLFGYAYHLYNGGDPNTPDSYNATLLDIAQNSADKPNIMTEYENYAAGWLKTGWLINNVLTKANASAYFYWDLMWPDHGLIDIDNPWDVSTWGNVNGYTVNPPYYAFKHFSKHIKPGYKRVSSSNSNSVINFSTFTNPAGNELVYELINTSSTDISVYIDTTGKKVNSSAIFQSAGTNYYQTLGNLNANKVVLLPANSMTTIVLNVSNCTGTPTVDAGSNESRCENITDLILDGVIGAPATGGVWTSSGTGTFAPNSITLNATYSISNSDKNAGTVTLTLSTTGATCNTSDEMILTISPCTAINKAQKGEGVKIYPVPATYYLNIDLSNRKDVTELTIINSIGTKVNNYKTPEANLNIDVNSLPSGLYILLFKTSNGDIFTKEFIKNE